MAIRKTTTNPPEGSFAWRVKNARTQMGMTQETLAIEAGISRFTITSWESGMYEGHSFEQVLRVAEVLDVSLNYMAGLEDEFGVFPFTQPTV